MKEVTMAKKYKTSYALSERDKKMGAVWVLKKYKIFKNSAKNFELSGTVFICSKHGKQHDTSSEITDYDMFGGAMHFAHKCLICDEVCSESFDKSEFIEREYIDKVWKNQLKENDVVIPFEQVEFKQVLILYKGEKQ